MITYPATDQFPTTQPVELSENDCVPVLWFDSVDAPKVKAFPVRNLPGFNAAVDARIPAGLNYRAGATTVALLQTTLNITFSSAMPNNNYAVIVFGPLTVGASITKNNTGFSASITVGLAGPVNWFVVPLA